MYIIVGIYLYTFVIRYVRLFLLEFKCNSENKNIYIY